jgi:hypothetical protein
MKAERKLRESKRRESPDYRVTIEYEPAEDAEDRLLRAYEFLLASGGLSRICSPGEELT